MSDARKQAEEALAIDYSTSIAVRGVPATIRIYVEALRALLSERGAGGALHFVFADFPGPGSECVFVECEDDTGRSINAGEWRRRADGLVELVVSRPLAPPPAPSSVTETGTLMDPAVRDEILTYLDDIAEAKGRSWADAAEQLALIGLRFAPPPAPEAAPHEWEYSPASSWEFCRVCGVVRRADNENRPCRGPVSVTLRSPAPPPAPEAHETIATVSVPAGVAGPDDPIRVRFTLGDAPPPASEAETPGTTKAEGHDEQAADAGQPEDETERRDERGDAAERRGTSLPDVRPGRCDGPDGDAGGRLLPLPVLRGGSDRAEVAPDAAVREAAEQLIRAKDEAAACLCVGKDECVHEMTERKAEAELRAALSSPAAPAKVRLPDDVIRGARNLDGVEIADAGGNCTHVSCSSDTCDVCGTRGVWGNGPAARGGE